MSVVSAFLVPGSPLPRIQGGNPPWSAMAKALSAAGDALASKEPDSIVVYSTQWIACLINCNSVVGMLTKIGMSLVSLNMTWR